jgi:RNA polymerase sigma-70 factor (ECF subfamily)
MSSVSGVDVTSEIENLFREHQQLVYRTAYSVTGSKADAEDVLQSIFLRLLRRGLPADLKRNTAGYLYRAAINLSLDTLRSRKRRHPENGVEDMRMTAHPSVEEQPDDHARRRLREAVAQLRPRAVEIVVLRYVHDYTDVQIAKMLGTSRGTIAVGLFRARARLRTLLSHEAFANKSGGTR